VTINTHIDFITENLPVGVIVKNMTVNDLQ